MRIEGLNQYFLTANKQSVELNKTPEASFGDWVTEQISSTNDQLNAADQALHQLASGHTENLHHTMILLEEAKLSFQFMEQIRNRLMSAYQELLREQI